MPLAAGVHQLEAREKITALEVDYEELAQWRATFPGKSAADVARLLREQRPLTAEEKAWVEKAWQEYKAIPPKDTIACMKCGFTVSRPVEGRAASNCQNCGAAHGREAFL